MKKTFLQKQSYINNSLSQAGKIAVCKPVSSVEAVKTAQLLFSNGVYAMEIAYRGENYYSIADECIKAVHDLVPEMLVGAATVTSPSLARRARNSGASFILTAGLNEKVIRWCMFHNMPVYPGCATPGEIETAFSYGLKVLKLFPAENLGGPSYLKALSGPYPEIRFIVSGGLNEENAPQYALLKNVLCISGSFLTEVCYGKVQAVFSDR